MNRLLSSASPIINCPRTYICRSISTVSAQRWSSTSSTTAIDKRKAYSATLLLPKTNVPLRHKNPVSAEIKYRDRTTHELYREQYQSNQGEPFILHDGPPYANGNLHMGHALNKILKDIINRYNVIRGRRVHYKPGWDCHGLPIEHKALQALGRSHLSLDVTRVRQEARKFALQAIEIQKTEMKALGVMADWDAADGVYRTLDHKFEIRQLKLFRAMVGKGFISHRLRPTYYSPSSRTALAEAELEYQDLKSHSVYVAFPVDTQDMTPRLRQAYEKGRATAKNAVLNLVIWTTTPWSLPGNMGVAVGEEISYVIVKNSRQQLLVIAEERLDTLDRMFGELEVIDRLSGHDLIGTKYTHTFHPPSSSDPRPFIFSANYVTAQSGTGLVHSAPAHGHEDYEAFNSMNHGSRELRCPVDDEGRFTTEVLTWAQSDSSGLLVGKEVLGEGSKEMINLLQAKGVLLGDEIISHRYPCDWRTKKPIIIRATPQWFADVESLKEAASEAIADVNFVPETGRNRLLATVLSRSEWCISRQRSWGVPIPALFDSNGKPLLSTDSLDHIIGVLEERGLDHWWAGPVEDFIPPTHRGESLTRGTDTLDVWFDSGTSWSLIEAANLRSFDQPLADVYLEGSDQHRGWFQSSLLTRLSVLEKGKSIAPYANVITHGFTMDEAGAKMSKSHGNGLSPMDIVQGTKNTPAYGSDTLRLWAAGVDYTRDMSIGPSSIAHASEVLRKLRSTLRFIIGNTSNTNKLELNQVDLSLVERYILHELQDLESTVISAYNDFTFNKALQSIVTFTSSTLSAFYFDFAKDTLYCDRSESPRRQAVVSTLHYILSSMIKMIAPIVPHLAEELYESSNPTGRSSVFLDQWTPITKQMTDSEAHRQMTALLAIRSQILLLLEDARTAKHLRSPSEAAAQVIASGPLAGLLSRSENLLPSIFGVSSVYLAPAETNGWVLNTEIQIATHGSVSILLHSASDYQCPRCWLYTSAKEEALCGRCEVALGH